MSDLDPDISAEAYKAYRDGLREGQSKPKPKPKLWRTVIYVVLAVVASFVITVASYGLRELFK